MLRRLIKIITENNQYRNDFRLILSLLLAYKKGENATYIPACETDKGIWICNIIIELNKKN